MLAFDKLSCTNSIIMYSIDQIKKRARAGNGMISARAAEQAGFSRGLLPYLVQTGEMFRVSRGLYCLPNSGEDELYALQSRFACGVYALKTALYLWGLIDCAPQYYEMIFPAGYNLSAPKASNLLCRHVNKQWYALGISSCLSPAGNRVRVYSRERTLCDILRPRNRIDKQTIAMAMERYLQSPSRSIRLLSQTASTLRVKHLLPLHPEVRGI